ncbi:MAG: WD40 repeat domain-containing protein, partial [Planctomycetales bacterium]
SADSLHKQADQEADYDLYARAVFAYGESLEMWADNSDAASGLAIAKESYAKSALSRDDLELASSAAGDDASAELLDQIQKARREQHARSRRIRLLSQVAAACLLLIAVGSSVGALVVSNLYGESERQRIRADRGVVDLKTSLKREQRAKLTAVNAKQAAEDAQEVAEVAQQDEREQRRRAEEQLYSAQIGMAGYAVMMGDATGVRGLFGDWREPPLHAGWEWRYFKRLTDTSMRTYRWNSLEDFACHPTRPLAAIVLREVNDGRVKAMVKLIDLETGAEVRDIQYSAKKVLFSPDGATLYVAGAFGVAVWDVDGEPRGPRKNLKGGGSPTDLKASADNRWLAATIGRGRKPQVCAWNLETGEKVVLPASACDFDPETNELIVWGAGDPRWHGRLLGVDPAAKKILWASDWSLRTTMEVMAVSPDGRRVALAHGHEIQLFDLRRRAPLERFLGHTGRVNHMAFDPDTTMLISVANDQTARKWMLTDRLPQVLLGHEADAAHAEFASDGRLMTSDVGGEIKVWDAKVNPYRFGCQEKLLVILDIGFSEDGKSLCILPHHEQPGRKDAPALTWTPPNQIDELPYQLNSLGRSFLNGYSDFQISPDGRWFASPGNDPQTALIRETRTGKVVRELKIGGKYPLAFGWSGNSKRVAAATRKPSLVEVWDVGDGKRLTQVEVEADCVALNTEGTQLAASHQERVSSWTVDGKKPVFSDQPLPWRAGDLQFRPDGRQLAACAKRILEQNHYTTSGHHNVWLIDASDGNARHKLPGPRNTHSIAYSPDGGRLGAIGGTGRIYLWNTSSAVQVCTLQTTSPFQGGGFVRPRICFSQDGKRIAAWSGRLDMWTADPMHEETVMDQQFPK